VRIVKDIPVERDWSLDIRWNKELFFIFLSLRREPNN
jgi:hypothetical protein